jgi:hypothetical protein
MSSPGSLVVPSHTGIVGNERADQLAGKGASKKTEVTNFDCLAKRTHIPKYSMAKDTEADKGKHSIISPAPKISIPDLDSAPNRLSRTIALIRTGYWLCAPYLKRARKNRDEVISDKCWWRSKFRMSWTHLSPRCTHQRLENARNDSCDLSTEEGIIMIRLTSVGQLLGKSKWEKRLPDSIMTYEVGLLGYELIFACVCLLYVLVFKMLRRFYFASIYFVHVDFTADGR